MKSIDKLLNVAKNEIGYLEKRSNIQLDSKTANAGSSNYTKYARDLYPSLQGSRGVTCLWTGALCSFWPGSWRSSFWVVDSPPTPLHRLSIIKPRDSITRTAHSRGTRCFLKTPSASVIQASYMRSP